MGHAPVGRSAFALVEVVSYDVLTAVNCLIAMSTALQPSTSVSLSDVAWLKSTSELAYIPKPVDTSKVHLTAV